MRCYTFLPGTFSTKLNSDLSAKMNPIFMNKINIKKTLWTRIPFALYAREELIILVMLLWNILFRNQNVEQIRS